MINCSFCNRTFLPERLSIHNKICTAEKPFKPLPPKGARGEAGGAKPPASNTVSKGLPNRGGGPSGPSGGGYGGGKASMGGGAAKSSYRQEQYDEEEEEQPAYKPTKPTGAKPQAGRSQPAKQTYQQPEEEEYGQEEEEEEVYKKAKPMASKPQPSRNQGYSNQVKRFI